MSDYSHLVGHRFPGGSHTLQPHEAWLWDDSVEAEPEAGAVHPGASYMIGFRAAGTSIQDLMDVFETPSDAGVMMAEVEFEFAGALVPGTTFEVEGEVFSVERKRGRRTGAFDLVGFVHRLRAEAGADPVAVNRTWIAIPRPGE